MQERNLQEKNTASFINKILPCPYCGSKSVREGCDTPDGKWHYVECDDCHATSKADLGVSGAIENWNTRPIEDALREQLDKLGIRAGELAEARHRSSIEAAYWASEWAEENKAANILRKKLDEYEGENKRWHSFETVQAIVKERDELRNKLEIVVRTINNLAYKYQYDTIEFFVVNLPSSEQIMTGRKTTKVWFCTKCKKNQRLDESEVIEDSKQMPFYSRYVPMPPVNNHGLLSQLGFHSKMVEWIWLCLDNLEEAFARFRDDNWSRGEKLFENFDIDTSIEESQK